MLETLFHFHPFVHRGLRENQSVALVEEFTAKEDDKFARIYSW